MAFEDMFGNYAGMMALFGAMAGAMIFVFLAVYVYSAIALMTIAKKTKTKNPWLAWIPIANVYLLTQIAKKEWWYTLIILLAPIVPLVGGLASMAAAIWMFWRIAEMRHKPAWISLLMIIPLVNLVILGVLAWTD